jgi:biotin synthase
VNLAQRSLEGPALSSAELVSLLGPEIPLLPLLHEAFLVRAHRFERRVRVHVLSNAQNARCPEDCGYCAQSAVTDAPVRPYRWKPREVLLDEARAAYRAGAFRYCIVASGRGPTDRQIDELCETVRAIKAEVPVQICTSLGLLDRAKAERLRDAGVDRLNHNLNTSESHYPEICSTHTYADRLATLGAAREVGLPLCSGMIVGMGEKDADIATVASTLAGLEVPSIPVNFLIPIDGNPVQGDGTLTPERVLRVLAMFRLANPQAELRIAAGREGHLGAMEPLALYPANSLFVDGYLTTRGAPGARTYRMIRDAGFVVERADGSLASWDELGVGADFEVEGDPEILRKDLVDLVRATPAAR